MSKLDDVRALRRLGVDEGDLAAVRAALEGICDGDEDRIRDAEAVLARGTAAAEEAFRARVSGSLGGPALGSILKDYEILGELGRGGMGVVYKARHRSLDLVMALKILGPFRREADDVERFRREAKIAAQLRHPGIVDVFDFDDGAGGGPPFYAMPYVEGHPLGELIKGHFQPGEPAGEGGQPFQPPSEKSDYRRWAARLGVNVARALDYAHHQQGGLIHRDIKPANLLVNGLGEVRITDFGLARRTTDTGLTDTGASLGTPAFMSPEQVEARHEIDRRSDVYSLGVTLYELFTGRRAFPDAGRGLPELFERIKHGTFAPPRKLDPAMPDDLETILLKAMAKEPSDRYATAGALADDLENWLENRPIRARRVGLARRFVLRYRREPKVVALTLSLVATLLVGTVVSSVMGWNAAVQRNAAVKATAKATTSEAEAKAQMARAVEKEREAEAQKALALRERDRASAFGYRLLLEKAEAAIGDHRLGDATTALLAAPFSQVGWETHRMRLEAASVPYVAARINGHDWSILDAALGPDGSRCVTSGIDGRVVLSDLESGRAVRALAEGKTRGRLPEEWLHYRHDFGVESLGSALLRGIPWLPRIPGLPAEVDYYPGLAWVGTGKEVAAASLGGRGVMFDTETGERRDLVRGLDPLWSVAASGDGGAVLYGGSGGRAYLRSAGGGARLDRRVADMGLLAAEWCPSPRCWLVGTAGGLVLMLDPETLVETGRLAMKAHRPVWSIAVSPRPEARGARLLVGWDDPIPLVVELGDDTSGLVAGRTLAAASTAGASSAQHAVHLGEEGRTAYALDDRGRLAAWDVATGRLLWLVATAEQVAGMPRYDGPSVIVGATPRFSALRMIVAAVLGTRPSVPTRSVPTGLGWHGRRPGPRVAVAALGAFRPVLAALAGRTLDRLAARPDLGPPLPLRLKRAAAVIRRPGSGGLVTAGEDKVLKVWDDSPARRDGIARVDAGPSPHLRFDARVPGLLWALASDGTLRAVDADSTRVVSPAVAAHPGGASGMAVVDSSAGGGVATAGLDGRVRLWELAGGVIRERRPTIAADSPLLDVAVAPDGGRVAAVDALGRLHAWDLPSGRPACDPMVIRPEQSGRPLTGRLAFSPDGKYLAAFGPYQSSIVVSARTLERVGTVPSLAGDGGTAMIWHPDHPGLLIVADVEKRVTPLPLEATPAEARTPLDTLPSGVWVAIVPGGAGGRWFFLSADGRLVVLDPRNLGAVLTRRGESRAVDMAADPRGTLVAIAPAVGPVEIWDGRPRDAVEPGTPPEDRRGRWTGGDPPLVDEAERTPSFSKTGVAVGPTGRVGVAYVRKGRGVGERGQLIDIREGDLWFAEEGSDRAPPTRVSVDLGGRVAPETVALVYESDGTPAIVYRRSVGDIGTYAGVVQLARRQVGGTWTLTPITIARNAGFHPVPMLRDGRVAVVWHFSFSGHHLLETALGEAGWFTRPRGRWGDGFRWVASRDELGRLHALFTPDRYSGDRAPAVLYRPGHADVAEGEPGGDRREVIAASVRMAYALAMLASGPVALVVRPEASAPTRGALAFRRDGQWRFEPLPRGTGGEQVALAAVDGAILLAQYIGPDLILSRRDAPAEGLPAKWSEELIARLASTPLGPPIAAIHAGPAGEVIVVTWHVNPAENRGWVRVQRRR